MTDSSNYSFANYNSLVENTEASANAVTDALVRTIRVVHQLANSMATQEGRLHDVIGQLGAFEVGTHQKQRENFTENVIARLSDLELWRSKHAASYGELTDSFTSLKHSVGVHAGRFERSDRHIQEWAGTLKDKERHAVENLEALRSKIETIDEKLTARLNDTIERHERLNEYVKGQDDPSSTFGDNVLASLQALREGGHICELFGGDMAEIARDVIGDTDFADNVEQALGNMDVAEYINVHSLDQYDLWDHIRGYVEDYVCENTISDEDKGELDRVDNAQGETIDLILERLKLIGFALDPRDRELHGDTRTDKDKFHDGMRAYSDFLSAENRRLLAQFANDLLDSHNKEEEKTSEVSQDS